MENDESFEKHVNQGKHEVNHGGLEAAEDGFESDEEFLAGQPEQRSRTVQERYALCRQKRPKSLRR